MQQKVTRLILEKLSEIGILTIDIFFPPGYSYTQPTRRLFGLDSYPYVKRDTLSTLLCRLRRQGLIERHGSRKKSSWTLTEKGTHWVNAKQHEPSFSIPKSDGISRLVIFDIPERERKKRSTLRVELMAHNFRQLQKSVWIGNNPLSEEFLTLLDDLNIKKYVHLFSVRHHGTIEEI